MKWKTITLYAIAIIALGIAVMGLFKANQAFQLALSDIELEERNTLMTPVYDEATQSWAFLAIYETSITNQGPASFSLKSIEKMSDGAGFLIPLAGQKILDINLSSKAFLVKPSINEIQQNPRLIKSLTEQNFDTQADVDLLIESGQSKSVRFGVMVNAYNADKDPLAQMLLLSLKLNFDNGKIRVFRRGIPVQPLK